MIYLRDIDQSNLYDCVSLERKIQKYVADATFVLAEAYTFRHNSTAYGIYNDDTIVGLVIVRDNPAGRNYGFTDLFIADNHQGRGYAKKAVEVIIDKFRQERKAEQIDIEVHQDNSIALHIYKMFGFSEKGRADWDNRYIKLSMPI